MLRHLSRSSSSSKPKPRMGCVQAKPDTNGAGSARPVGLERLKMDNGYEPQRRPDNGSGGEESDSLNGSEVAERDSGRASASGGRRISGDEDELVDGWPKWLTDNISKDVLKGLVPKSADSYDKLDKVGEGTYSNVYKARDRDTGKIVALKKVRFDTSEPESVKFMAREIMLLRKLDHPNVLKLEGLATSRMQYSIYLVFDFMHSDLAKVISKADGLTEPQVKCYMHQLLSGLQHCHDRGILHRDIKGSNLLIDKNGVLKIGDFGLANYYAPKPKHPLTNRVVTLWYRAPELLLGATDYGVGIDLWSAGCVFAEMFTGRPLMPGRTEVEQLHRIFKLCGTPSEEYWKKLKLSTTFRPPRSYKPSLQEAFKDLPSSALGLLGTLLALDPAYRGSAGLGLKNEFFSTSPLACDLSGLPVVYNEEEELKLANEQRKFRNSKVKQRSRKQREHRRQDVASFTQEEEKTAEPNVENEEPGSATSSTSSGVNQTSRKESPIFSLSPVKSADRKLSPKNGKILPPIPKSKARIANYNDDSDLYRSNLINRSLSTREFRKSTQREKLELYAIDD
ncbi:probable serine/threonine-protein kinase At1g54610 [Argentina anserina]|uniref:probable serine/threonine-protein kinase At1g54610 n=1 Tax=Argentina anserina TaxID=57926 RepID=UPI0021763DDF|nr:probable serine/threonine-protein kinase At1g54610 [Potentilla anserina]